MQKKQNRTLSPIVQAAKNRVEEEGYTGQQETEKH